MNSKNENFRFLFFSLLIIITAGVFWYAFPWLFSEEQVYTPDNTMVAMREYSIDAHHSLGSQNVSVDNGQDLELAPAPYFVFVDENGNVISVEPLAPPEPVCAGYPCYDPEEFIALYDSFESQTELPFLNKYIYQNPVIDSYIRSLAESRGYQQRVFADETDIVNFAAVRTRTTVKHAYEVMRDEMAQSNIRLHLVSGYRSSTDQRRIFIEKMNITDIDAIPTGIYDNDIDQVLEVSAIPGYSKHHSGYAVDFGCGNDYLVYQFAETECYDWLSAENYKNAKRFGFIPSYPEGGGLQGPNPEPWEFVWVGEEFIKEKAI